MLDTKYDKTFLNKNIDFANMDIIDARGIPNTGSR
jgi:hypothetical protein